MECKSQSYNCITRELVGEEFSQLSGLEVMTTRTGKTAQRWVSSHHNVFLEVESIALSNALDIGRGKGRKRVEALRMT